MGFIGFPHIIGWELTLSCNIRCDHCATSAGHRRPQELSEAEALAICDQLPELLVREVDFTGGEPLMCSYWEPLALRLRDLGITTRVLTNGRILNPALIARIQAAGMDGLAMSLDGLAAHHDALRGSPGLFDKVIHNIDLARAAGLRVGIITTVTAANIGDLAKMLDLLIAHGVNNWQLQPIFPLGRGRGGALLLSPEQYLSLDGFMLEHHARASERGLLMIPADGLGYYGGLDELFPSWRGCGAGLLSCGIMSDGRVKGCLSLPDEFVEGDLRQRSLWDIWFDPGTFQLTRGFRGCQDLGANCQGCDKGEQCRGGCSVVSYSTTGQLHNNPYCFSSLRRAGGELHA